MQQLENTIQNLNNNTFWAVKIEALPYLGVIANNMTAAAMVAAHGSVEQYFQYLGETGVQKIRITDRKSNGSSYKTVGQPYDVSVSLNEQPEVKQPEVEKPAPTPAPTHSTETLAAGLMGPGGLGYPQIHALMDHPRLEREVERLRDENKRQAEKIIELDKIILKNDILDGKSEATAKAQAGLLETAMPLLAPVIAKLMGPAPGEIPVGLNAPAEQLSEVKNWAVNVVKATDDDSAVLLGKIGIGIDASEVFFNEIIELMKKHEIIPAA